MKIAQMKQDFEQKPTEKEEINCLRCNQQRSTESTLDYKSKARQEAVQIKKKMEGDINHLKIQLGHAFRQVAEAQKQAKSVQAHFKDQAHERQVDQMQRHAEGMREQSAVTERRSNLLNLLTAKTEELRSALAPAERGRKLAETEI